MTDDPEEGSRYLLLGCVPTKWGQHAYYQPHPHTHADLHFIPIPQSPGTRYSATHDRAADGVVEYNTIPLPEPGV